MDYSYSELVGKTRQWLEDASESGWLSGRHVDLIEPDDAIGPTALFSSHVQRPLVVAFFGGTGVGKSSLLNRLAGQSVAKVGVVRPTSREVSIYLHESIEIEQLPKNFPVERIRVARHQEAAKKDIMWLDMPDIDSTDRSNRDIVLEWMPHIDVLVYVVNPERYRDEKGWRLLLSRSREHAWLFVMNQADRAKPEQLNDFKQQVMQAGFSDPVLLTTDCREAGLRRSDEFDRLESIVLSLANAHTIRQLDARGLRMRTEALRTAIERCVTDLGPEEPIESLVRQWDTIWTPVTTALQEGLTWSVQEIAKSYVAKDSSVLRRRLKLTDERDVDTTSTDTPPSPVSREARGNKSALWDDWVQARVDDAFDQWLLEVDANRLPVKPFKQQFEAVRAKARDTVLGLAEQKLRRALANPGNRLQRVLMKLTSFLSVVLPLTAIGWVAYQVFYGFYEGSIARREYLGTDFAIHSGLVIATAWLLPWFVYRSLRPSTETVARKGLQQGLSAGFDKLGHTAVSTLEEVTSQRNQYRKEGLVLRDGCAAPEAEVPALSHELLARMLIESNGDAQQLDTTAG